jgi:hypothetical protein
LASWQCHGSICRHQLDSTVEVTGRLRALVKPQIAMFDLLTMLYKIAPNQSGDACAMYGQCTAFDKSGSKSTPGQDQRSAKSGVYTAEEVRMYRTCYSDFTSKFQAAFDSELVGYGMKGYVPVDGNAAIEAARKCWGPITGSTTNS